MKGKRIEFEEGKKKSEYQEYNMNGLMNRNDTNYHSFNKKSKYLE